MTLMLAIRPLLGPEFDRHANTQRDEKLITNATGQQWHALHTTQQEQFNFYSTRNGVAQLTVM